MIYVIPEYIIHLYLNVMSIMVYIISGYPITVTANIAECFGKSGFPEPDRLEVERSGLKLLQDIVQLWQGERDINELMKDPFSQLEESTEKKLEQLCTLQRNIYSLSAGSIIVQLLCHSLEGLEDLWRKENNGELSDIFTAILSTPLSLKYNLEKVTFRANIRPDDYEDVKKLLALRVTPDNSHQDHVTLTVGADGKETILFIFLNTCISPSHNL